MRPSYPVPVGVVELGILAIVVLVAVISSPMIGFLAALTFDQLFNLGEGLLWLGIGLVIATRTLRSKDGKRIGYGAAVSFALFGVSDFIEMRTGAWYSPWSLLALKAACVASLLAHFIAYRKRQGSKATSGMPGER